MSAKQASRTPASGIRGARREPSWGIRSRQNFSAPPARCQQPFCARRFPVGPRARLLHRQDGQGRLGAFEVTRPSGVGCGVKVVSVGDDVTVMRGVGSFDVRHGTTLAARVLARLLGLPAAGVGVSTRLVVTRTRGVERWYRTFAGRDFVTEQRRTASGLMAERAGAFELLFRLDE